MKLTEREWTVLLDILDDFIVTSCPSEEECEVLNTLLPKLEEERNK